MEAMRNNWKKMYLAVNSYFLELMRWLGRKRCWKVAWWPQLDLQKPQNGRIELTTKSCILTSTHELRWLCAPHTQISAKEYSQQIFVSCWWYHRGNYFLSIFYSMFQMNISGIKLYLVLLISYLKDVLKLWYVTL